LTPGSLREKVFPAVYLSGATAGWLNIETMRGSVPGSSIAVDACFCTEIPSGSRHHQYSRTPSLRNARISCENGRISLSIENYQGPATVRLFDASGRSIHVQRIENHAGRALHILDTRLSTMHFAVIFAVVEGIGWREEFRIAGNSIADMRSSRSRLQ
jgi:hypothetical protein